MSGQLWFMLGAGVMAGGVVGLLLGRWSGLSRGWDDGYEAGRIDERVKGDPFPGVEWVETRDVTTPAGWQYEAQDPALVGHTIYPELAALADVPEPASAGVATREPSGLGHPSPYTGHRTPAQRRRDKHKQRGDYAPGVLPDPPTDVGAWWQAELDDLLESGQSEWLTRQLAEVA